MRSARFMWLAVMLFLSAGGFAQVPAVITMDQEPHHHLSLKNDYVKVFRVEVAPGDSILMHRHDQDTIAIAIGDQMVTVGFPDKPAVHQENPDGQLRLQKTGYVHSTGVDPGTTYHTVAIELLQPQGNPRNLCVAVMAGQPIHCVDVPANIPSAKFVEQPQFQSDQTRVDLVRVRPGQKMTIGGLKFFELIVALDPGTLSPAGGKGEGQALHPGDFVWFVNGAQSRVFTNPGKSEARIVKFQFTPIDPKGKLL
jgi:hypothetical protein